MSDYPRDFFGTKAESPWPTRWASFNYAEIIAIGLALETLNTFETSFDVVKQARRLRLECITDVRRRESAISDVAAPEATS